MNPVAAISALLLASSWTQAGEVPVGDPDLPHPWDLSFVESLVAASPFTRTVSLEDSFQLTGMAFFDGHPVATILNRETQERFVVSEEPNAQGWTLMAATTGTDIGSARVEMRVGTEALTLHYGGQQLSPGPEGKAGTKKMYASSKKSGGKTHPSSFLGDGGRERYESLSSEGRSHFKELVRAHMEKHPELSPEQSADYARKVFAKIQSADVSNSGDGPAPSKASKPSKKRQA